MSNIDKEIENCHSGCMSCIISADTLKDLKIDKKEDLYALENIRKRFETLYEYLVAKRNENAKQKVEVCDE